MMNFIEKQQLSKLNKRARNGMIMMKITEKQQLSWLDKRARSVITMMKITESNIKKEKQRYSTDQVY
jgi:hypothetical protein